MGKSLKTELLYHNFFKMLIMRTSFTNLAIKNQNWFSFWTLIIAVISHTLQGTMYCWLKAIIVIYLLSEWSFTHSIQKVRSDLTKTDKTIHTLLWRHRSNPSGIWTKRRKKMRIDNAIVQIPIPTYLSNTYIPRYIFMVLLLLYNWW